MRNRCTRCGGNLLRDGSELACLWCGARLYPLRVPIVLPPEPEELSARFAAQPVLPYLERARAILDAMELGHAS